MSSRLATTGGSAGAAPRTYPLEDRRAGQLLRGGLWLAYVGIVIRGIFAPIAIGRNLGRLLMDIAGAYLITAGAYTMLRQRRPLVDPFYGTQIKIFIALSLMATFIGVASGNNPLAIILHGVIPFYTIFIVALAARSRVIVQLPRMLFSQLCVSILLNAHTLIFNPPRSRVEWVGAITVARPKVFFQAFYPLNFLVACAPLLKPWQTYALGVAWVEFFLLALLGNYRGPLLTALLMPLLAIYSMVRAKQSVGRYLKNVGTLILVALVVVFALKVIFAEDEHMDIGSALAHTVQRLTKLEYEEHSLEELSEGALDVSRDEFMGEGGRSRELEDFISSIGLKDYLVGRGFGGTWYSHHWGMEWGMVHFGPAYHILLGGLGLILSYLGLLFSSLRGSWLRMALCNEAGGAFSYLTISIIGLLKHGVPDDSGNRYMIWVSMGVALAQTVPVRAQAARASAPAKPAQA